MLQVEERCEMRTRAPPRGANLRLLRSHPLPFGDRLSTLARQPTKHDSIGEKRKILSSGNAGEEQRRLNGEIQRDRDRALGGRI